MIKKKKICICADDFGMSASISEGIIDLVKGKKIQAVSCILNKDVFLKYYKVLKKFKYQIDIGLHINLTENKTGVNLKFNNISNFFSSLRLIIFRRDLITKQVNSQIKEFERYFEFKPKHIDGHHHIHQLPLVSSIIINSIKSFKPFVRQSGDSISNILSRRIAIIKSILISLFSKNLILNLKKDNLYFNESFSGIYEFNESIEYKKIFHKFLVSNKNNHLIMCHPAKKIKGDENKDSIKKFRHKEYFFYLSKKFEKIKKDKNFLFTKASKFNK